MNRLSIVSSVILSVLALSFSACSKQAATDKPADKTVVAPPVATAKPAATTAPAAITAPAATPGFESLDQKVSYGIGFNIGSGLARENVVAIDQEAIRAGIADGLAGSKPRIPEADLKAAFTAVQQKAMAAAAAAGEKQKAVGAEFLAKNKARPEVKVTASGLQYEVLKSGTGPKPKESDMVQVHYHGTLVDGTVFDSSVERGQPADFQVGAVIQGWIEALQLMSVGDKFKLYISPALGYGERATGKIPANSVLIFEVELLAIK